MSKTYIKLDGNLIPIFLGAKVVPEPQNKTWIVNEEWIGDDFTFTVNFISNNTDFSQIKCINDSEIKGFIFKYDTTEVSRKSYGFYTWVNQAYRTVTFETAPTGDLLTWLQDNAVKQ